MRSLGTWYVKPCRLNWFDFNLVSIGIPFTHNKTDHLFSHGRTLSLPRKPIVVVIFLHISSIYKPFPKVLRSNIVLSIVFDMDLKKNRQSATTLIYSLPEEILIDILARVGEKSASDLFSAKLWYAYFSYFINLDLNFTLVTFVEINIVNACCILVARGLWKSLMNTRSTGELKLTRLNIKFCVFLITVMLIRGILLYQT